MYILNKSLITMITYWEFGPELWYTVKPEYKDHTGNLDFIDR